MKVSKNAVILEHVRIGKNPVYGMNFGYRDVFLHQLIEAFLLSHAAEIVLEVGINLLSLFPLCILVRNKILSADQTAKDFPEMDFTTTEADIFPVLCLIDIVKGVLSIAEVLSPPGNYALTEVVGAHCVD